MRELIEVADGVFVATSRRDATTSTVVVRGREAVLIDPAWDPDELVGLADWLVDRQLVVLAGISTHAHHDHLLWHPRFGDSPRWSSARTAALARRQRAEVVAALGAGWPPELGGLVGRVTGVDAAAVRPFIGSAETLELIVHDGHCPGHTAVWLPERRVLVAGDMFSDVELPLPFDPDDLPAYRAGLAVLAPVVEQAAVLIPGHGTPTGDPRARLAADRAYLAALGTGVEPDDPRLGNPGMTEVHTRLERLLRE